MRRGNEARSADYSFLRQVLHRIRPPKGEDVGSTCRVSDYNLFIDLVFNDPGSVQTEVLLWRKHSVFPRPALGKRFGKPFIRMKGFVAGAARQSVPIGVSVIKNNAQAKPARCFLRTNYLRL